MFPNEGQITPQNGVRDSKIPGISQNFSKIPGILPNFSKIPDRFSFQISVDDAARLSIFDKEANAIKSSGSGNTPIISSMYKHTREKCINVCLLVLLYGQTVP